MGNTNTSPSTQSTPQVPGKTPIPTATGAQGDVVPPPPMPSAVPPPMTPPISPPTTPIEETKPDDAHPGTYEDLHKKCKDIFPQVFEGGKFILSKGLSSHFQISHTLSMGTFQPSGYRFGCTYIGKKQFSPQEAYPVLVGDIDASGNLNANIIHAFTHNTRSKFVAQIQNNKWVANQASTDYKGENCNVTLTAGNLDLLNETGILVGQYLQQCTKNLALGSELVYQYGQQVPGGEMTVLSFGGRLTGEKWTLSGNVGPGAGALHACYHHQLSDTVQVGAEIETSLRLQESVGTIGYQMEIPSAGVTFRGQLDTNWCVGAVMEKKLQPFPFTFALSGYANHVKASYRFGIGLIVG